MALVTQDKERLKKAIEQIGLSEDQFRIFASMVTHKDFDELMDRSKYFDLSSRFGLSTIEARLKAKKKADRNRQKVQKCLSTMDQDLHMVFKVNNYLNTIFCTLGNPVENYYYIVRLLLRVLTFRRSTHSRV